jgi:5-(carboxyamino)imidazole ribonucleotide synthase
MWPLTENVHSNGILSESRAPAPGADELTASAKTYLERLLERLDYVGVLALELFVCGDELLANEYAPRVHNSGHWTIEGAECSQFENHVRAILDMPLGGTAMRGFAGMLNLIGRIPSERQLLDTPPAHLHDYGKDPRPGRKLGHVTVVTEHVSDREATMKMLAKSLKK